MRKNTFSSSHSIKKIIISRLEFQIDEAHKPALMQLNIQTPQKATRLLVKQPVLRSEMDVFKANLIVLLDKINAIEQRPKDESEEHLKNDLRDFLRDTYYRNSHAINTKDKKDLVIHTGQTTDSDVAVLIEAKRPTNVGEMVSADNFNKKALYELILYYLDERSRAENTQLKHLIITNINEWYVIDANAFDKHIYRNTAIRKLYETKTNDRKDNPFFYEEIAKIIAKAEIDIDCVYFNLKDYNTALRKQNPDDDRELTALYKLLSPQHLLKVATPNDANSLNERFYKELLHIIGLEETKDGGKSVIRRKATDRHAASLLEAAIDAIETEDVLHHIPDGSVYGATLPERTFAVALELCITWINRILFLKLLEGQLIGYHSHDSNSPSPAGKGLGVGVKFLNNNTINDFDELFKLFHKVLAVNINDRTEAIKAKYGHVPYLNSSLFDISELEDQTIKINSLDNGGIMPLMKGSILAPALLGRAGVGLGLISYLFQFLDAYDFASDGKVADIQDDNRTIINASVLGKVFEKINGYKDGSIYTPAFITMYMCRQTIRQAVVEKFNEAILLSGYQNVPPFKTLNDVYDQIGERFSKIRANQIVNSLKICDPAVGSGHFLVSALNEIIAIKNDLKILGSDIYNEEDRKNVIHNRYKARLRDYDVEIVNDELQITDENGRPFVYNPNSRESQRVQEILFHEKQTIIENCLFGVDINPNSVKICRLRLWIELLKNAYYCPPPDPSVRRFDPMGWGEKKAPPSGAGGAALQTLPNIDINIKCGNSLLSRFALDADLSKALRSIKYDVAAYRGFVNDYKNEKNRDAKRGLTKIIAGIKADFKTEINKNDKKVLALNKLSGELYNLTAQTSLLPPTPKEAKARQAEQSRLETEINKLAQAIDDIKNNAVYRNAFEWRFEFPEVLNDDGEFVGFDVVIGNPPYFSLSTDATYKHLSEKYLSYSPTTDIYALFCELGQNISKTSGLINFIISNKWMRANYGKTLRKYLSEKTNPLMLIDFGQNLLFDNAIVHTNIVLFEKAENQHKMSGVRLEDGFFENKEAGFQQFVHQNLIENIVVGEDIWNMATDELSSLKTKIETIGIPLKDWDIKINFGIKTGYNEAFIIDKTTKDELLTADPKNANIIKPILRGRDTRKYYCNFADLYLINSHNGYKNVTRIDVVNDYPNIYQYLLKHKEQASIRFDKGFHWTNLRNCAYLEEFEKPKIIFSEIVSEPQFHYDTKGYYPEATAFFISGQNLKYLLALLNSKAVTFFFKNFYMGGELVGKIRYKKAFLENVPIPVASPTQQQPIIDLVDAILLAKASDTITLSVGVADQNDGVGGVSTLEAQIDELVYELYGITAEERAVIEGK